LCRRADQVRGMLVTDDEWDAVREVIARAENGTS
jgi:hypothetical protein